MNHVELVGWYGGDETHALSAWTSTRRELTDERRGRVGDLLKMLASSDPPHTSPFEKSYLHFLVTCDTASHIHVLKHRIGVSVNGESARYKEHVEDKWHVPSDWPWLHRKLLSTYTSVGFRLYHWCLSSLESRLTRKRAKESARFFLPYSSQVTLDVGFNFQSFAHFQRLRNDDHAQDEIHDVAQQMLDLVRSTGDFDLSLEAYELNS